MYLSSSILVWLVLSAASISRGEGRRGHKYVVVGSEGSHVYRVSGTRQITFPVNIHNYFFPNVENAFGTPVVHVLFFIFEGLILFAKLQQKHKRIAAALQS